MIYRLTESFPLHGMPGATISPGYYKTLPYNEKDLYEPVTDEEIYTEVIAVLNNQKDRYLTFSHDELLTIIMRYTEPVNIKYLQKLTVSGLTTSVNSFVMHSAMISLKDIFPISGGLLIDRDGNGLKTFYNFEFNL